MMHNPNKKLVAKLSQTSISMLEQDRKLLGRMERWMTKDGRQQRRYLTGRSLLIHQIEMRYHFEIFCILFVSFIY